MQNITTKKNNGFTLVELLAVVAILAVLVSVAIPVFSASKEKAARATDAANARAIKAMLSTMYLSGEIVFDAAAASEGTLGVYVIVCRDADSVPAGYGSGENASGLRVKNSESLFCGANEGVSISGEVSRNWKTKNTKLEAAVLACFDNDSVRVQSGGSDKKIGTIGGWDWYIVQLSKDTETGEVDCRIFSGNAEKDSDIRQYAASTNIESYL